MPSKNSKFSRHQGTNGYESAGDPEKKIFDPDSTLARSLQPLLEQEALLEYVLLTSIYLPVFESTSTVSENRTDRVGLNSGPS
jgi:hypothetical protein